ncbi:hypothetical protein jhhlp_001994 [Lomentospora prolificans]|uniref:Protein-S-isoprenylcysteine O-methyltransferase n=1 Tax=Lomentospora prolificans TaxID=41688 RepID=A0A2N3NCR4_9PEZI|nr:hypothetical protein jhhlp_001994 [Lomentospora prolificans]
MISRSRHTRGLVDVDDPADITPPHPDGLETNKTSSSPDATFDPLQPNKQYYRGGPKSLSGIATRAFCLGAGVSASMLTVAAIILFTESTLWRIPFFLGALSLFHFFEFWTTAAYNTPVADLSSFLLTANWPAYPIAHAVASLECFITNYFWPTRSWAPFHTGPLLLAVGLFFVVMGQSVRTTAMIQCGESFNHIVQHSKKASHSLVTTGLYSVFRHPAYFAFFWWAVGTQLVLGNVLCFVAYTVVLWRFFSNRIANEELFLTKFFGDEYVEHKKNTRVWIPFIP